MFVGDITGFTQLANLWYI